MKIEFSRPIFEKYPNFKFNENPSGGSRVVPCGQTDRRDEANSRVFAISRTHLKVENSKYEINLLCFKCNHNEFSANKKIHLADRGGSVGKVLCYKSEGRWFDPRWWNFSLT